ncbi:MAG: hypothetical protein JRJ39_13300 [Deltaproteobacteria bacterium]|nr:hypothetical protein [Deltaproteobacteria bacterium]
MAFSFIPVNPPSVNMRYCQRGVFMSAKAALKKNKAAAKINANKGRIRVTLFFDISLMAVWSFIFYFSDKSVCRFCAFQ